MSRPVDILYRGPLASCNYGCEYCPFAKRVDGSEALRADAAALARFVDWAAGETRRLGVFFTPWGEALTRAWYRDAVVRLSALAHVRRVAAQTNLSAPLDWLDDAVADKVALWCTYHPEWTERARFLAQVAALRRRKVACSVGMVGFARFVDEIEAMRRALPAETYLWINAPKDELRRGVEPAYDAATRARLVAVDPYFADNTVEHPSHGQACRAGADVVSVDGDGVIRRCHFVDAPLGNLYAAPGLDGALAERPCPNDTCGCHIGYVHLDRLRLRPRYGDGILERIPVEWPLPPRVTHIAPGAEFRKHL